MPTRFGVAAMGRGPSFTPSSIAGIEGWWKADSFSLSNGDSIDSALSRFWVDSTGNGHDMAHGGTTPATYQTNVINALPVVRFVKASNVRFGIKSGGVALASDTNPYTYFIVLSAASAAVGDPIGSSATGYRGGISVTPTFRTGTSAQVIGTDATHALSIGTFYVQVVTYNQVSGAYAIYQNSATATASGTNSVTVPATGSRQIGGNTTNNNMFDGDIAECGTISGVISSGDRTSLVNYLGSKYNITIT